MGGGGKGDERETVSRVEFPSFIRAPIEQLTPSLLRGAGGARSLSPQAQVALENALAGGEAPMLSPEAQTQLASTLSGDFLFGGPAFERALEAAEARIVPSVVSAFGGRAGNPLAADLAGRGVGQVFAGLFDAERQRQIGSLALALEQARFPQQRQLQALPFAFQEAGFAADPFRRQLGLLSALLGAPVGGTQTATSTPGALSIIGTGIGAAGSLFGLGGPFGAGGAFG